MKIFLPLLIFTYCYIKVHKISRNHLYLFIVLIFVNLYFMQKTISIYALQNTILHKFLKNSSIINLFLHKSAQYHIQEPPSSARRSYLQPRLSF